MQVTSSVTLSQPINYCSLPSHNLTTNVEILAALSPFGFLPFTSIFQLCKYSEKKLCG